MFMTCVYFINYLHSTCVYFVKQYVALGEFRVYIYLMEAYTGVILPESDGSINYLSFFISWKIYIKTLTARG